MVNGCMPHKSREIQRQLLHQSHSSHFPLEIFNIPINAVSLLAWVQYAICNAMRQHLSQGSHNPITGKTKPDKNQQAPDHPYPCSMYQLRSIAGKTSKILKNNRTLHDSKQDNQAKYGATRAEIQQDPAKRGKGPRRRYLHPGYCSSSLQPRPNPPYLC